MPVFMDKYLPCPGKEKVAGTMYRLKLSTLCDLLEIYTLYPGFWSRWKLQLNKTTSGVDQQANK